MSKFKYKILKTQTEVGEAKLNALGAKGWELCGFHMDNWGYTYYIKKQIEPKSTNNTPDN